MGELGRMINNNEIDLRQFFTMHPFSATEKISYDLALKDIDFFKNLYIQSNKTYEHLVKTISVLNNKAKNLLVITGYRGCGKTNFLHFIKHLAANENVLINYCKLLNEELEEAGDIVDLKESIEKRYRDSLGKIRLTISGNYSDMQNEDLYEKLITDIPKLLKGKYQYINFDENGMEREKPLSTKLFFLIRSSLQNSINNNTLEERMGLISNFVDRNKWTIIENFEIVDDNSLQVFWLKIKLFLKGKISEEELYKFLREELKCLSLEQILFLYTLWDYSGLFLSEDYKNLKLVYLLDNIDIISDDITDIFKNTMTSVWKYIWDSRNAFTIIKEQGREEDRPFIELYEKSKFIVAMRETTAMHISGHLRDKMYALMEHFDISMNVDEARIMKRRIDVAEELIVKDEIRNIGFINAIENLKELNKDRILMKNLFQLNNNDYRTSSRAITTVCYEHEKEIKVAIRLINSTDANEIFGGRGIIYHLFLDAFFDWNYFEKIGIKSVRKPNDSIILCKNYGYSCARIILTILCNRQSKVQDRFFVSPEESVRLSDFKGMMGNIFETEDFVKIIDGMYALREKQYWNHLITFDNIQIYSPSIIRNYLNDDNISKDTFLGQFKDDIYIRATPAGQIFADLLSVHYEYFVTRFSTVIDSKPLFTFVALDDRIQYQTVKQIINDVYRAVKECCENLKEYNQKVLKERNQRHYREIVNSSYYYEQKFHEERIIHSHISYLEAYRHHILKSSLETDKLIEINTFLLEIIKKYLNLLKYDPNQGIPILRDLFYSNNSEQLYNELSVCIEEIEKDPKNMLNIEITRNYYNRHYNGKKCAFLKERNLMND